MSRRPSPAAGSSKPILVDAHGDLAWNMLNFGRDYTRSAAETRQRERDSLIPERNGDSLIGWPDYQRGRVAVVFSTLFAAPLRTRKEDWDKLCYSSAEEAHRLYMDQARVYRELAASRPDCFRLIRSKADLQHHVAEWTNEPAREHPVGLVLLMEGAEAIRHVDELPEWHAQGVRLIGLAWAGTRYAGGTREPGPLTKEGRHLLRAMAEFNFVLDLSHMDEAAALEALDFYPAPIAATHVNCLALLPNFPTNRHFSDRVLRGVIERQGVIGIVPFNAFLKPGWNRKKGSRREQVTLDDVVAHLDHVCQLAGDAHHAGLGSDFDGGFGLQSVPSELDTIADLQKLAPLLARRGYSEADVARLLGGNWLDLLQRHLPA